MLNIQRYPHADYNSEEMTGYLAYYYPYVTHPLWRDESYSPEILDFKEGKEEDIKFCLKPFCALIQYALSSLNEQEAVLIPVPSSIAWNDPDFTREPLEKGQSRNRRNRDNRNNIFCSFIHIENNNLKPFEGFNSRKRKRRERMLDK